MPEVAELVEGNREHGEGPLVLPVSITISIMAVLVAAATLMGHRAHTEELLLQSQATDQWAYYQAKNGRYHGMQVAADMIDTMIPRDKDKAEAKLKKYEKEIERYDSDKEDISEKAKELEKERDLVSRRADRFDGGEALLEIGLVICSITLLTKRKFFWFGGMLIGVAGVAFAVTGFLIH
jgi:hypothetical protein